LTCWSIDWSILWIQLKLDRSLLQICSFVKNPSTIESSVLLIEYSFVYMKICYVFGALPCASLHFI
jgi:hypothetical protein